MAADRCESSALTGENDGAGPKARAASLSRPAPASAGRRANRSEARSARSARRTAGTARGGPRLHRQQAFALHALARELARPADCFRLLARLFLGGVFVVTAELPLAGNALALPLLLQRLEGVIDIVVTDETLHASSLLARMVPDVPEPADRR